MKKGMKLIAFMLAAVVTVSSVLPANVYANTNVDDNTYVEESILAKQTVSDSQLKSELAELYQKCLQNSGKTSFHGWCGAFVGQQLNALGIDSKTGTGFNGNGNTWYPCLLDNVETNSGHTQKKYAGRDCLKSIAADAGDEPAYNIVVSFPNSTGSNTSYGHVIFIYAIVGNTAYYIESYGTSFGAEGTPIARDIDGLMNEYCSLYGTAQGAVWFSGGGGISYINDDEMFSKYPYYLNDDTYNAMFRNARSEIYDALDNADSSRMLIAIMTALSDGKDLIIKQLLSSVTDGIDSTSDEAIDKATLDFVQTMLGNETFLSSFITSAQSKIKGIKLGYDLFSATGKEAFSKEASTLLGVHKEVFDLQLSKFLDNTGKVAKITKYGLDVSKVVASAVEMEYINIEVVEQLKTLLIQYGYDNTELYEGISRLDAKLHLDITTRVFDTVANDAVLNILSEVGDTVFNALVSEDMGIAYAIVNVVAKASVYFFYEKLGNGIKLDDVLETYALYEFQDTLFALKTDMYMELLSGKADLSSAAENYELIWNAYRAGIVSGLNSACEITKSKSLKSVRENMKETLTGTFTYDKFLERCRATAMQAVVNGNAVTVGSSNTDSNAESKSEAIVEKRLAKIIEMYPSGSSKFEMMYDNKKGSFAFTEFVFRTLYENIIDGTVASDKQYVYSRPYQTTKIGTLHGSEVSEDAIGILISKAKVGDVILGYGEKYGLHSMIFKEATDNGIVVYDSCWDKEKNGDYTVLLHEIPYTELAEWVGNGTSESEGGLSLYHYISYNSLYKRNSEIQADDKDNFIIDENGVLTGYKGYKTFVKIPDTVKAIGDNAFKNNDMIRNIYIPDSVTIIGENAFYDCDQLTSVFIPDSVTSVGSSCFYSCNNLTYAKLPQNMDVVSSNMFYECKKLETVVFGMNVTKIGEGAFRNCGQLKVDLPGNIVKIGDSTFRNCKSLTEITIPKSLTDCSSDIFSGCSNLKTIKFEKGITTIPAYLFRGYGSWFDGLEEIDIPETVTTIGEYAFNNCKNLTTVTGMKNVTEIGSYAFYNCNQLKVDLPGNIVKIGDSTFKNCKGLTEITIPKSLTDCSSDIFSGCSNLKTIKFEKGITTIPAYLFRGYGSWFDGLEEIDIPETVTTIGEYAFNNCKNLTTVTGMKNVTEIGDNAFYNCSNLVNIKLPENLAEIGSYAFDNCSQLKVDLPGNIVKIGEGTFRDCKSLTEITIPKSLTDCSSDIFSGCSNLKTIKFEKGITTIPAYLFRGYGSWFDGLEEIDIPETVTTIGEYAFNNCKNLTTVTGMKNVTEIGDNAFYNCSNLVNIKLPENLAEIGSYAFDNCSQLKVDLPGNIVKIGEGTFRDCKSLTEITIPKSLTDCSSDIFSGCSNLKTIKFEKGITTIPAYLFRGYGSWFDGLEEIDIPETVTTIGAYAFYDCRNLTTVTGMKNVTKIGDNAFYNCSNLKEITIPDTVESMGTSIFYGCTSLKSVVLPNKRVNITDSTFCNCTSLESITLPDTVEYIRNNAFYGCSSLKKIVWSKSIKEIENNAFKGCSSLTEIIIPDGVTSIGSNAFQNCTSLASVRIPNSVTSLGTYIFDGCSSLTDVTLGKGLTTIPSYMFSNCESLKNIKIPYNVATIGSYAFLNDTAFTEITIPRKTTAINSNAFSYPGKLNIYGISGTYAETFANENNIKFTNREVNASKVELNESQITLNKGDTYNLIMSVTPDDFTDAVTWKSTDTDVVTVTETGVIKAVGTGTATVKLTVGNVSTSCRITVLQPVTSISLDRSSISLDSADNYQLSAYIYPSTASNKNVVWESSDPSVATVDDNGMVTALKKGTAKITVKAMDGSNVSASCTVTVKNTTYVCDTVDKIESQHNYENECSDSWIYTIEGAECIEVGFDERTAVESGFDYIYIFSADDTMVGQYTGTDLAGKTIRIEGSKVRIKLESDGSGNEWGFKVTSVKRASKSHMMELIPAKEATCIEEGNNSYYYCSECNKYFKDEAGTIETTISDEIIPVKKYHEYVNGYCKYCNKAQYEAGWKKTSTGWWYDNGDGTYPKNEWKYIDGKWYHFDERGYRQTGWKYIGSNWYFFNESGDMRTGWFTRYGKTYYCKPDGSMARQFVKVGSSTYYFDSEGALQTGWKKVGNKWYYMNSNGIVQTGWKQLGKNWYYLNSDGSMQTGWKQVGRYWYYMDGNGVMQTGWKQIGKNWYYMDSNGVMQTGWKYIGKNWYYMDGNGVMQTGWKTISGRRYYFYANGAMR